MDKVPKYIKDKVNKISSLHFQQRKLILEVTDWIEFQGIDTYDEDFANAILVRIENGEFRNTEDFEKDLIAFFKGKKVGYG